MLRMVKISPQNALKKCNLMPAQENVSTIRFKTYKKTQIPQLKATKKFYPQI